MPGPDGTRWRRRDVLLGAAGLWSASLLGAGSRAWATGAAFSLSNGTILTHEGQLLQGQGVRIEDGRIVEIGAGVLGGRDLNGDWLVPGFTDAGCLLGLLEVGLESATHDQNEGTDAVTPDARVWNGYNALSDLIPVARLCGITTVLVHPATNRLVSGQAALFHTAGERVSEALVHAPAALCINLGRAGIGGDHGPQTRMGVAMRLRQLLDEADPPGKKVRGSGRRKEAREDQDERSLADQVITDVRAASLPVLAHAHRVDDILFALELARDFQLDLILLGAAEGHLVAGDLADAGVPVFVGPTTVQPNSFEHLHARYDNAAKLFAAGVKLGLRTGSAHRVRNLPTEAGIAVAHGLPFEAAIRALTANPAEVLGLSGFGRLELGAEATFFQASGDPLQPRTRIQQVWIAGRPVEMSSRQTRLYQAFRELD